MKTLKLIAFILILIGALNWGLVGFFHFDFVVRLFGTSVVTTIVYDLVGIAALFKLCTWGSYKHK